MQIIYRKNPNTEIFILNDKKTKPFVFQNKGIKLDGILRDALFKYHLTQDRRQSKVISLATGNENHTFKVPNYDVHNVKSILIDSLKR